MAEIQINLKSTTVRGICKEARKILLKVIYTIDGRYGEGEERKKNLGSSYQKVQSIINFLYNEGDLPLT